MDRAMTVDPRMEAGAAALTRAPKQADTGDLLYDYDWTPMEAAAAVLAAADAVEGDRPLNGSKLACQVTEGCTLMGPHMGPCSGGGVEAVLREIRRHANEGDGDSHHRLVDIMAMVDAALAAAGAVDPPDTREDALLEGTREFDPEGKFCPEAMPRVRRIVEAYLAADAVEGDRPRPDDVKRLAMREWDGGGVEPSREDRPTMVDLRAFQVKERQCAAAEAQVVELTAALRRIADTGTELTPGWTHWRVQAVEALAAAGEGEDQ